jgi:hypothetical protein
MCATDGKRGHALLEQAPAGDVRSPRNFSTKRTGCAARAARAASTLRGRRFVNGACASNTERRRHRAERSLVRRCACLGGGAPAWIQSSRSVTKRCSQRLMRAQRKIRRSDLFDGGGGDDARCGMSRANLSLLTALHQRLPSQRALRACRHVRRRRAPVMLGAQHAVVRRASSARAFGAELAWKGSPTRNARLAYRHDATCDNAPRHPHAA